ncbi:MAG: ECF transporter S component [Clostridia bacterium]|nr:ECF transporter S component [Clostridia bacterium]
MNQKTKKITFIAMLCALSYVTMMVMRIPVVLFLKYEAKDVFITMGGFIFGPLTSVIISLVVSLVEMITVSETGVIGCIMNILSTCSFAGVAALVYKKKHNMWGAVTGLILGTLFTTAVMLLWNYLITPLYMEMPREQIAGLLIPAFLPFNLIKGTLNTAIILLIYKPVVSALRRSRLIPASSSERDGRNNYIAITIIAAVVLATCVLTIMALNGML